MNKQTQLHKASLAVRSIERISAAIAEASKQATDEEAIIRNDSRISTAYMTEKISAVRRKLDSTIIELQPIIMADSEALYNILLRLANEFNPFDDEFVKALQILNMNVPVSLENAVRDKFIGKPAYLEVLADWFIQHEKNAQASICRSYIASERVTEALRTRLENALGAMAPVQAIAEALGANTPRPKFEKSAFDELIKRADCMGVSHLNYAEQAVRAFIDDTATLPTSKANAERFLKIYQKDFDADDEGTMNKALERLGNKFLV